MHSTRKVLSLVMISFITGAFISGAYVWHEANESVKSTMVSFLWTDILQGMALVSAMEEGMYDSAHESLVRILEGHCETILLEENGDTFEELVSFVKEAQDMGHCL